MLRRAIACLCAVSLAGCYTTPGPSMESLSAEQKRARIEAYAATRLKDQSWLVVTRLWHPNPGGVEHVLDWPEFGDQLCGLSRESRELGQLSLDGAWRQGAGRRECFDYAQIAAVRDSKSTTADAGNGAMGGLILVALSPVLLPLWLVGKGNAGGVGQ